jgi:hypothetical protein
MLLPSHLSGSRRVIARLSCHQPQAVGAVERRACPARSDPHLFVAHLALLLGCALHKALTRAKLTLALDTALEALCPIRLVELDVAGQHLRLVTRPGPHGQAVLRAVGIHQLAPPGGRCGKQKSEIQENQGV